LHINSLGIELVWLLVVRAW